MSAALSLRTCRQTLWSEGYWALSESTPHSELDTGLRTLVWEAPDTDLPVLWGGAGGQIVDLEPEAAVFVSFSNLSKDDDFSPWVAKKNQKTNEQNLVENSRTANSETLICSES